MICGRWVLDWMTLLQWPVGTEDKGTKCRNVLSLYVNFVAAYGFLIMFIKGGHQLLSTISVQKRKQSQLGRKLWSRRGNFCGLMGRK